MLAYKNNEEKRIFLKNEYKNMILNIETFCLSIQTYNNIRLQHSAFMYQAKIILFELTNNVKFWPMLFSTQSRLEAEFSKARMRRFDSSSNYSIGIKYNSHKKFLHETSKNYNYDYGDLIQELELDMSADTCKKLPILDEKLIVEKKNAFFELGSVHE